MNIQGGTGLIYTYMLSTRYNHKGSKLRYAKEYIKMYMYRDIT